MEAITLEQLSAYLPYKVKAVDRDMHIRTVVYNHFTYNLSTVGINHLIFTDGVLLNPHKLILRPLSDLTETIVHDGVSFNPLVELIKLQNPNFEFTGRYSDFLIEKDGYPRDCCRLMATMSIKIIPPFINHPHWVIKKLHEWHFDTFGLIEKGLAIDINTIKNEK